MQRLSRIAAAMAVTFVSLQAGVALAQTKPDSGTATTAAPAAAPAPASTAPATAPAATTTTPAPATAATTTTEPAKGPTKKKSAKMTRQQEIDKSVDSGTVPARYRSSMPKQYQQYIPFEKQ